MLLRIINFKGNSFIKNRTLHIYFLPLVLTISTHSQSHLIQFNFLLLISIRLFHTYVMQSGAFAEILCYPRTAWLLLKYLHKNLHALSFSLHIVQYHTDYLNYHKTSPVLYFPPPPQTPGNHKLICHLYRLTFLRCHINVITQYVAISDCLL